MIRFDGRRICDCRGFYYNDLCRHLVALARSVPSESTRELLLSIVEREGDAEPGRFNREKLQ